MNPLLRGCIGGCALAVVLQWLVGCAPQSFKEDGIQFLPTDRTVVEASVPRGVSYRVDAVALRPLKTVLYANDTVINESLREHELKHFRPDPQSPTGYCEHLPDGKTWLDPICQN